MDRKTFLALIPSLSAVPFLNRAVEKTHSGILLLEPEPITPIVEPRPKHGSLGFGVQLTYNGAVVAHTNEYETESEDHVYMENMYFRTGSLASRIGVRATFNYDKLMEAISKTHG